MGSTSVIHGGNIAATNGIIFSSGSLTAVFLTAPEPDRIRIKLDVDSGTPLGAYSFTLTGPTGNIQSGAVLVNVNSSRSDNECHPQRRECVYPKVTRHA